MTALVVVLVATAVAVIAAAASVSWHWWLRRLRTPDVTPLGDAARRCYSADQERLVSGPEAAVMRARVLAARGRAAGAVEGAAPAAAGVRSAS